MANKSDLILKEKNLFKTIFKLALPIMICNIIKSLHDMVDMFFIGKMDVSGIVNGEAVLSAQRSAISFTGPVFSIFQALAMGFMIAGVAIMSQYIGAKKEEKAKKVSGQLLVLCIMLGIVFNVILYFAAPLIMKMMNATPGSYDHQYSVLYLRIRSFEMIGLFIFYAYQASRQAEGDTLSPVIVNTISIVVNIILTGLFVLGFKMDIRGAAIATVIGNLIIVPICLIHLFRKKNSMSIQMNDLKLEMHYTKKIFRVGIPAALSQIFTSMAFVIVNSIIYNFDDVVKNGISVGGKIHSILLFPAMAFSSVLATLIGQNIGANNVERAKKCFKTTMLITLTTMGIGSIVMMFLREPMARIFLDNDIESIKVCSEYLVFLLLGLPAFGAFQVFTGLFQGSGRTEFSLISSGLRLWGFRIPFTYLLLYVGGLKEASIWYAMVLSNTAICMVCIFLYRFIDYKPRISSSKKRLEKVMNE